MVEFFNQSIELWVMEYDRQQHHPRRRHQPTFA
jgi:hypothetical protein